VSGESGSQEPQDNGQRDYRQVVRRQLAEAYKKPAPGARAEVIDILHTLTSFETFDNLAGATRRPDEVVSLVCRLAHAALRLKEG
jgi:hypothetical protein